MAGFRYRGRSTEDALQDCPLMLLAVSGAVQDVVGVVRQNQTGEQTIARPIPNDYGTISSPASIQYSIVRRDLEPFTIDQQRIVQTWLTSAKLPSRIQFWETQNCKQTPTDYINYRGKFLETTWHPVEGGWSSVSFVFQCDAAYPFIIRTFTYDLTGQEQELVLNLATDEQEEYVYPLVLYTPNDTKTAFKIRNTTDNGRIMQLKPDPVTGKVPQTQIRWDCKYCMINDAESGTIFDYTELGWTDISDVYFLRLIPGENILRASGNGELEISAEVPFKQVGGWL